MKQTVHACAGTAGQICYIIISSKKIIVGKLLTFTT